MRADVRFRVRADVMVTVLGFRVGVKVMIRVKVKGWGLRLGWG